MAKGSSRSGTSKVRLIVFEAEVNDGDLSQFTHAIQNALQPRATAVRVIQGPATAALSNDGTNGAVIEDIEVREVDEQPAEAARPRGTRVSKPKVAKTPTVLNDIDVASEPSLKDFIAQFDITSTVDKYLAIALWFRDARDTPVITVDHVYTCFKMLSWGTNSNDFSKPLRNLRDEQSFKGGSREGFALTLPGAGKIEAKRRIQ